jgi:ornithine cyclodeaminase/alanine dehydrogenase-like protein (mu-crystallin family)
VGGRPIGALRYLSRSDVLAAMPGVEERLALAERTLTALVADAELPPKLGVHPRAEAAFAHAMPALLHGASPDATDDLLGMKWVVGFPTNAGRPSTLGGGELPTIAATVILNDATTGLPRAILDAGAITAHRTAAVSGVAIARWATLDSASLGGRRPRVAMIGTGVQARSHLPVLGHLVPGASLSLCGRDRDRAERLAAEVRDGAFAEAAFGDVEVTLDPDEAVASADLVITLASFGPARGIVDPAAFAPEATIVAADYDVCVPAVIADHASLFLTDDRGQFLATRAAGTFVGYPDPDAMIGEAMRDGTQRPAGRVLVTHLGVGLADVVFGDAILRVAEEQGLGTVLDR